MERSKKLTRKQKTNILKLFFRTKLNVGEEIIDNQDKTIADELGLNRFTVGMVIKDYLDRKLNKINKKSWEN